MFNRIKVQFILLLIIMLPSCRNSAFNGISEVEVREVQSEVIQPDLFLGRPYRLLAVGDKLVIADQFEGDMLCIKDLSSEKSPQRLLRQGKGPHERLNLRHFFVDSNNRFILFDAATRDMIYYRLSDGDIEINPQTWDHTARIADAMVREMVPLGDLILTNGAYEGAQFRLYNPLGEPLLSFGSYPGEAGVNLSPEGYFLKNQTQLAARPDGKYFAAAGVFHDQLSFYEMQDGKPVLLKEYFSNDSKMDVAESGQGERKVSHNRVSDETIEYYTAVYPTQKHLYVVYTAAPFQQILDGARPAATVYAYTWNGEPVCGYKMPIQPKCIAVDEHDRTLYAVVTPLDELPQLIRFSLD